MTNDDISTAKNQIKTTHNILNDNPKSRHSSCYVTLTEAVTSLREAQLRTREAGATDAHVCEHISTAVRTCRDAIALIENNNLADERQMRKFFYFLQEREKNVKTALDGLNIKNY